jgi:hypothetical protein
MFRRLAAVGTAVGAVALCPNAVAAVQDPVAIAPNEPFLGLVNSAASNGVIQMGCFGPYRPGEMGHPLAGQSTEVELATNTATPFGFTGAAREIQATLTFPTPVASPIAMQPITLAKFTSYFVRAPISTALTLPCGGTGEVAFTPVDGGPTARPWNETVTFAGQP